jgi:hypothetical protein
MIKEALNEIRQPETIALFNRPPHRPVASAGLRHGPAGKGPQGRRRARAQLEVLRSEFNLTKIQTLNEVMTHRSGGGQVLAHLSGYGKELAGVSDRKLALAREFLALHKAGTLDDPAVADDGGRLVTKRPGAAGPLEEIPPTNQRGPVPGARRAVSPGGKPDGHCCGCRHRVGNAAAQFESRGERFIEAQCMCHGSVSEPV